MSYLKAIAVCLLFAVGVLVEPISAQAQTEAKNRLVVDTKEAPPFAIKNINGTWGGLSIDPWRAIATDLNLEYELRELDLTGPLRGLEDGSIDVAVAALTITAERETVFDFTHPFHTSGLGIAVASKGKGTWVRVAGKFFSKQFLKILSALALVLFVTGFLIWLLERRRNPGQFGGSVASGIGAGFWWSAVTVTTVGYGDKAPVTFWGRVAAILWIFAGIIMISSFTAAITSALTVTQLESAVRGFDDLPEVRVAGIAGSTSEAYLSRSHIKFDAYSTPR